MDENDNYNDVLHRLEKRHRFREKSLIDRALNTKKIRQLIKNIKDDPRDMPIPKELSN